MVLTLSRFRYNGEMQHAFWVIDALLAGRPGPTVAPWNPAELYAAGIRTIVSLAADDMPDDLSSYGFSHYRAKFPSLLLTSRGLQRAFIYESLKVWAFIEAQLTAGNPTLVHCYMGRDRTGAILAGYLVAYKGLTPDVAIAQVRNVRPNAMEAEGYEAAVRLLQPGVLPDPRTLL